MSLKFRKYFAEAIGTYLLVFFGTTAIAVDALMPGYIGHTGIAFSFGLIVMGMVYSIGNLSGAHINPAVSIGFWVSGRFDGKQVFPYILAQFTGAILASLSLLFLLNPPVLGVTLPAASLRWEQAFVLETILTFLLMFVIIHVATGSKEVGIIAGMAIGGAVALDALIAGPLTGASMNPARSLGPAIISGNLHHLWIYLSAPVIGSTIAVLSWKFLNNK